MEENKEEPKARRFTVGYALAVKKQGSFIQDSLISAARERSIDLVPIDIERPLIDQGPFDCIVHKLPGEAWKLQLQQYAASYPSTPIVDPPDLIDRLRNRISMLDVVNELDVSRSDQTFGVPDQVAVYDSETLLDPKGDLSRLKFPMIAKPLVVDGTAESHEMALVFHREGLFKLTPPILLQEFVNHGGFIYKVYVVGDYVNCVKRKSLPDVSDEMLGSYQGLVHFSLVSNTPVTLQPLQDCFQGDDDMLPMDFIADIARALGRAMGLHLFNFDVIRDVKVGNRYLVIDINYFPGYAKMPHYETALTDFFWDVLHKGAKDGALNSVSTKNER